MPISVKEVDGKGVIVGAGIVSIPRERAERFSAVPTEASIEQARARYTSVEMEGVNTLIDVLLSLETDETVIGYLGFTIDKHGLLQTPLADGETDDERADKIMCLPHKEFGTQRGTSTAVSVLVALAEHTVLETKSHDERTLISQVFGEAAIMLSRGSSAGEA